MPNITIYVSDELAQDINRWRDQLNLSEIARGAIISEIGKLERQPEVPDDLYWLVPTLREQKANLQSKSYRLGYELGIEDAHLVEAVSYVDFLELERRAKSKPNPSSYREWLTEDVIGFMEAMEAGFREDPDDSSWQLFGDFSPEDLDREEWLRGFCHGVLAVWKKIKDRI